MNNKMSNEMNNNRNNTKENLTAMTQAADLALEKGFSYAVPLDAGTMELLDEVRAMCGANTCGMYGKNWACPPACGTLEECRQRIAQYKEGILVQTVGEIEDSLDFEAMMEIEADHKEHFFATAEALRKEYPGLLAIGAGCCTICKKCAYPDEPCRFPDKRISSLEAYGIVVSELCKRNNMAYYYGAGKMAYTSCFLLR